MRDELHVEHYEIFEQLREGDPFDLLLAIEAVDWNEAPEFNPSEDEPIVVRTACAMYGVMMRAGLAFDPTVRYGPAERAAFARAAVMAAHPGELREFRVGTQPRKPRRARRVAARAKANPSSERSANGFQSGETEA